MRTSNLNLGEIARGRFRPPFRRRAMPKLSDELRPKLLEGELQVLATSTGLERVMHI